MPLTGYYGRWHMAISFLVVVALVVGGNVFTFTLARSAIDNSQHRWCSTLELLTTPPVPKPVSKKDVSRERGYVFYLHLKDLERRFGC